MSLPEVIMHNSTSLDGRLTGFPVNMALHYGIVAGYRAEFYMAGSNTVRSGIETYGTAPDEEPSDFLRPEKTSDLSYWLVPDTRGSLKGRLHVLRRSEYCRDVFVLISGHTPEDYVQYLEQRDYHFMKMGDDFVDYRAAFEELRTRYDARRVLVDTGPTLGNVLLQQGLVNKISLLIHPCIVGQTGPRAFEGLQLNSLRELKPEKQEMLDQDYLHLVLEVKGQGMG